MKYRIRENTYFDGVIKYVPQCKVLNLFWVDCSDVMTVPKISYDTLEAAQRGVEYLRNDNTKYHNL